MRIVFIGAEQAGYDVLEMLIKSREDIVGIWSIGPNKDIADYVDFIPLADVRCDEEPMIYYNIEYIDNYENNKYWFKDIKSRKPDLIIVVSWSQIIPKEILDIPTGLNPKASRCYQWGYVTGEEKKQLYKEVYVYLRSVEHDGQPEIIIEMKKMGRHVICNYPYKHTIVAHTKNDIVQCIKVLYEKFRNEGRPLDEEGMKYYREKFTKNNFINRFIELFYGKDCLEKWGALK